MEHSRLLIVAPHDGPLHLKNFHSLVGTVEAIPFPDEVPRGHQTLGYASIDKVVITFYLPRAQGVLL